MIFAMKKLLFCLISVLAFISIYAQTENVPSDFFSSENTALYFGNPSCAVSELSAKENYLIEKPQFTLSYNAQKLIPNWVSWHLSSVDIGECGRSNDFRPDSQLPGEFYKVKKSDYQFKKYGFDRGHVCPSADRTDSQENNSVTFLMTNMIPQSPDLNRIVWKDLESYERELARQGNELYIIAGQSGTGGTSATGTFSEITLLSQSGAGKSITVPAYCWKILLVLPEGENDFSRVTAQTTIIAVYMPNIQGLQHKGSWQHYLCSVDYIEEQTGCNFFHLLPDDIEDLLEAKVFSE